MQLNDDLESEWHPTLNLPLNPASFLRRKSKYWWLGECGHEWEALLEGRLRGVGCHYCLGQKVLAGFNDLATINPALAREWHPTKNGLVTPEQIFPNTNKKYWWLGNSCGHEWDAVVNSRNQGLGCPVCSNRRLLTGFNDLATTNPELTAEWHPTKNGELTPEQVTAGISEKIWWMCEKGHEWEAIIVSRNKGTGCPYCSGRLLVGFNDLETVNPTVASQWHPTKNGELTARQVTSGSTKSVWWLGECSHEWKTSVSERNKGSKCPFCLNQKILAGFNDLAFLNPALAAEWHPTKNGTLTPEQISLKSNKKVWWQCKIGHEWEIIPNHRSLTGCPVCANKKVLSGSNDLGTTHPVIAADWHPTKNGNLTADQVIAGSAKKCWWLGAACGHEWEANLNSRSSGTGCPVCVNVKILVGFNDLATTNPKIAAEWHPTKNGNLTPQQVIAGSNKKYWWLGALCGHEWVTPVNERDSGSGCLICINKEILVGFNDLATTNSDLAAEWHPTKNGKFTANQISAGSSSMKVWWMCSKDHEWETTVASRNSGNGCPFCGNQKVLSGFNDLATTNPELAAEWHPTKNGELTAKHVIAGSSNKKYWWRGTSCRHEWEAVTASRNAGKGCPICANLKVLIGFNDLATTNPELAVEWHPTKNGDLTAERITAGSHKKVWWICSKNHAWETLPYKRTERGDSCPTCANKVVLVGFNDLATTNPELAVEWHPTKNGDLTAEQITAGKSLKVWWQCSQKHEWEALVSSRNKGNRCPICSNKKIVIGYNDLASQNPKLADEWHPTKNGDLTAEHVITRSHRRVWWQCRKGHEWEVSPSNRIGKGGTGCPQCWATTFVSKAEQEIHDYISALDNNLEVIQSDRKILKGKEIDIYIPSRKIAVEFNGLFWHSERLSKNKNAHYNKWLACKESGIRLIQIWEDDWTRNAELIERTIAGVLGLSNQRKVLAHHLTVKVVDELDAEIFLNENHTQGFVSGSCYLGLFEGGNMEIPAALLVFNKEEDANGSELNIIRYATKTNVVDGFKTLLAYAINAYSSYSVTAVSDNCGVDGLLYEANGFVEDEKLPPDYMYIAGAKRYPKSAYSMNKFRDDPKLEWAEGFTVEELAYLNDVVRIWDAGKTRYRYY